MKWVTVFTAFSPAEAQLIRSVLEAAGLEVNVQHELAALSMEGYSMTTGGIWVQVMEDKVDEARALIANPGKDPAP
jgi:Putative prokaryotic signal transducing protein